MGKKGISKEAKLAIVAGGLVLGAMSYQSPAATADQSHKSDVVASSDSKPSLPPTKGGGSQGLSDLARQCLPIGRALKKAGWPDVAKGVSISAAESGCKNVNNAGLNKDGSIDYCEMQINNIHKKDVSTIDKCARVAEWVRKQQGYRAWSSVNNGSSAKFISVGREVAGAI